MRSKTPLPAVAALAVGFAVSNAAAHTVWLEPAAPGAASDFRVMFGGHAGEVERYDPKKLKTVEVWDGHGNTLGSRREVTDTGVLLHVDGAPALIAMHFDNGIHSRGETGPTVEKPMNEVPGATRATYAVKHHKTVVEWSPAATRPIGQPFEVVPLDATPPVAGRPMRVRVLQDGHPVAGVRLGRGEEGTANDPVTDADGVAAFVPEQGFNKLWAGKRTAVTGEPRYTELSYEYAFAFDAK